MAPGCGLAAALRQFEAALARHQQLWDSLDDLDAHAWVVEPSAPQRRRVHTRRCAPPRRLCPCLAGC